MRESPPHPVVEPVSRRGPCRRADVGASSWPSCTTSDTSPEITNSRSISGHAVRATSATVPSSCGTGRVGRKRSPSIGSIRYSPSPVTADRFGMSTSRPTIGRGSTRAVQPGAPTDPDMRDSRVRLLRSWVRCSGRLRGPWAWTVSSGVPPDPVAWRRAGLPGSWGTPRCACPALRPRRVRYARPSRSACRRGLPSSSRRRRSRRLSFEAPSRGLHTPGVRFAGRIAPPPRNTRFRLVAILYRAGWVPAGFRKKVSETFSSVYISFPFSRLFLAH
jgi:hypothetical protein